MSIPLCAHPSTPAQAALVIAASSDPTHTSAAVVPRDDATSAFPDWALEVLFSDSVV